MRDPEGFHGAQLLVLFRPQCAHQLALASFAFASILILRRQEGVDAHDGQAAVVLLCS